MHRRLVIAAWAVLVLFPGAAAGQGDKPRIELKGRLQEHFYYFGNDAYESEVGPSSAFFTRRARIQLDARVSDRVSLVIQPSYEGGRETGVRLRDAFIDVLLSKPKAKGASLTLRMGQEKRPFSRHELTSSNNLPSIERGAGRGLRPVATNNLFDQGGFLSHDIGASLRLEGAAGRTGFSLQGGVYNGEGESAPRDLNDEKSFGARATVSPFRQLSVGGGYFSHESVPDETPETVRNNAWGVDAQWGKPGERGLFLLAEYLSGEEFGTAERRMRGGTVVAAVHGRLPAASGLYAVEPVLRFDRSDPDADSADDGSTLMTAGLGLYISRTTQLRAVFEHQRFEAAAAPSISGARTALTVNF